MIWLLAPFVHTPPHAAPAAPHTIVYERREEMLPDGVYCAWEAESLWADGKPIWSVAAPEGEHWCQQPFEFARVVDVLGQDGPFLSVRLTEWGCCAEHEQVVPCRTYDLRTGAPATLEAYDPRHAAGRLRRLRRLLARRDDGGGWEVDPSAFRVGGGHVRVCAARGDERIEVALR